LKNYALIVQMNAPKSKGWGQRAIASLLEALGKRLSLGGPVVKCEELDAPKRRIYNGEYVPFFVLLASEAKNCAWTCAVCIRSNDCLTERGCIRRDSRMNGQ